MGARSFADTFEIAGRRVSSEAPCYVIAEAGANHNRDIALARELIDVASEAGADAVKFQVYSGHSLYSSKTPPFTYLEDVSRKPIAELLEDIAPSPPLYPKDPFARADDGDFPVTLGDFIRLYEDAA